MGFELNYQKNGNEKLFLDLAQLLDIENPQNYIPIYNNFFGLNDTNYNNINLNHHFSLNEIVDPVKEYNVFKCCLKPPSNVVEIKNVFFKFSPLLDPVKYMIGKYDASDNNLLNLPDFNNNNCHAKSRDNNNSAYVDGFFTYLTSQLLHNHGFINGLDYYGSFLGIKKGFKVNVIDDLEYLSDSDFFNKNKGELFKLDNDYQNDLFNFNSRNYKKRLLIEDIYDVDNNDILKIDNLENISDINNLFHSSEDNGPNIVVDSDLIYENVMLLPNENNASMSNTSSNTKGSNSTCSSRTSNTGSCEDDDVVSDDGDSDYEDVESVSESISGCSTASEDVINATLNRFPVSIICLENCSTTLDDLMCSNELSTKEWASILMQIIMILITYQKVFNFTHNDLHTNNIMYIETEKEFLYYKYNNKHYKVPTYGKVFKIIDFGRAIYKFKGTTICSDSFHKNGDAATQYNFEPYMNENKPRLEPNYSFDLCRLACSMYDFLIPDGDINKTPITSLINDWCSDDKNRNVLYKTNDEERYPDFKLYKMIVRTVHAHTPQSQLSRELFSQFLLARNKTLKIKKLINIDDIPSYI